MYVLLNKHDLSSLHVPNLKEVLESNCFGCSRSIVTYLSLPLFFQPGDLRLTEAWTEINNKEVWEKPKEVEDR